MKKIIGGKKYDTETANEIVCWDNGLGNWRDFNYLEETLYQKKTGEYFLYGKGGANTKYAVPCGNNARMGGEKIIPLTEESAKEWAERCLTGDEYEDIFGEVEE